MRDSPRIAALVVAAGTGSRAGGKLPKQYQLVCGKPLLRYSVEALLTHPAIATVQVVIHPDHRTLYDATTHDLSLAAPVNGGAARADSVAAGLVALAPTRPDYVLIHDAARPFLSHAMLDTLIAKLAPGRAVLPARAVADTVRRITDNGWEEVSRVGLMSIQTPQGFDFAKLVALFEKGAGDWGLEAGSVNQPPAPSLQPPTDEAALWLAAGLPLDYAEGAEELRKVTTENDLVWAENHRASARRIAIGSGYDVHALMPTANEEGVMRIGGIDIPSAHKLHGHSDADVVLHAIVDALLGALAEGDIGSHFPPSDARWRGADSALFVAEALRLVKARGGAIQHLDVTIVAERPKISPHRDAMRSAIATMLLLPLNHVSVKATTTEKLGFTGREEGIAAHATATLLLPEVA